MLRSRRCSSIRSRICDCTVTSRAVVGSSANSSDGPQARAMAIITRWRMPPDNSWGYWLRRRPASGMRTSLSSRSAVARASPRLSSRWVRSGSAICLPIFISGFSDVIGSWKIIDISWPQMWRICLGLRSIISWPANLMDPVRSTLFPVSRPITDRDRTVLPEPDSPTMPSALPRSMVKLTSSTARTRPRGVRNDVDRLVTSSSTPDSGRPEAWVRRVPRPVRAPDSDGLLSSLAGVTVPPPGCRSDGPPGPRSG